MTVDGDVFSKKTSHTVYYFLKGASLILSHCVFWKHALIASSDIAYTNCRFVVPLDVSTCLVDGSSQLHTTVKPDDVVVSDVRPAVSVDVPITDRFYAVVFALGCSRAMQYNSVDVSHGVASAFLLSWIREVPQI